MVSFTASERRRRRANIAIQIHAFQNTDDTPYKLLRHEQVNNTRAGTTLCFSNASGGRWSRTEDEAKLRCAWRVTTTRQTESNVNVCDWKASSGNSSYNIFMCRGLYLPLFTKRSRYFMEPCWLFKRETIQLSFLKPGHHKFPPRLQLNERHYSSCIMGGVGFRLNPTKDWKFSSVASIFDHFF